MIYTGSFNFVLDFILIAAAVWAIVAVRGTGGIVGKAFYSITWGMIFLGIAHISETITFRFLQWDVDTVEFAHRLIVLIGIAFLVLGFRQIQKIQNL